MGLISSRFMTANQLQRCCLNDFKPDIIGYSINTIDGQRIGIIEDFLMDDESFTMRYLIIDTSTAAFVLNQSRVLLPTGLCCRDPEQKVVRTQARADQVQSAPEYDPVISAAKAYEDLAIFDYGERPSGPSQL